MMRYECQLADMITKIFFAKVTELPKWIYLIIFIGTSF